jgi:hypothetical protein
MPAPTNAEVASLKQWSLFTHYQRYGFIYVSQAKYMAEYLLKMSPGTAVSQDEIAEGLVAFFSKDHKWQAFLAKKSHLADPARDVLTEIMARYIAYAGYTAITS